MWDESSLFWPCLLRGVYWSCLTPVDVMGGAPHRAGARSRRRTLGTQGAGSAHCRRGPDRGAHQAGGSRNAPYRAAPRAAGIHHGSHKKTTPKEEGTHSGHRTARRVEGTHSGHRTAPRVERTHSGHRTAPRVERTHSGHRTAPRVERTHSGHRTAPRVEGTHSGHRTAPRYAATHYAHKTCLKFEVTCYAQHWTFLRAGGSHCDQNRAYPQSAPHMFCLGAEGSHYDHHEVSHSHNFPQSDSQPSPNWELAVCHWGSPGELGRSDWWPHRGPGYLGAQWGYCYWNHTQNGH